jgi:hypothetical protein
MMAFGSFTVVAFLIAATTPQAPPEPYTMTWSTLFGGVDYERAQGCAVDDQGFIYIVGNTGSSDLPTTPGAFQRTHS